MNCFLLLIKQQVQYKQLVERNKQQFCVDKNKSKVYLPLIIATTDRKTNIDCNISNDKYAGLCC